MLFQKGMFKRLVKAPNEVMFSKATSLSICGASGMFSILSNWDSNVKLANFWRSNTVVMFRELSALLIKGRL
jgi:hypothetical protein